MCIRDSIKTLDQKRREGHPLAFGARPTSRGSDRWQVNGDKWTRIHSDSRLAYCHPFLVEGGPVAAGFTLKPDRTTRVTNADGSTEVVVDRWDDDAASLAIRAEPWTGSTEFEVERAPKVKLKPDSDHDEAYSLLPEEGQVGGGRTG